MKKLNYFLGVAIFATVFLTSCGGKCDKNDPASECYEQPCDKTDPNSDCYEDPRASLWVDINGVKWATCNVDAHGEFAATPESYGMLYQWGRKGDGHEQRTSPKYPTDNTEPENGVVSGADSFDANGQIVTSHAAYGKFIKCDFPLVDWRSPQSDTLWNAGTENTPVKTSNDPCPQGWRVPTTTELQNLCDTVKVTREWTIQNSIKGWQFTDKINKNTLFLPAAGYLLYNGSLNGVGLYSYGHYWSSSVKGVGVYSLMFSSSTVSLNSGSESGTTSRGCGFSIRCVAE